MATPDVFSRLIDELGDLETILEHESSATLSSHACEAHKEEVKSVWENIKREYHTFIQAPDCNPSTVSALRQHYTRSYQTYIRCIAKIGDYTHMQQQSFSPPTTSSPRSADPPSRSGFNLPPCDTECFIGDYAKWPSFRDLFVAVYINNSRLSDVEKLFHLRHKTKGEAHEIVCKAPLTNDGFGIAWKDLTERFENKRLLVNNQIRLLLNLKSIHTESSAGIRKIQRDINGCISALRLLNLNVDSWDAMFVFLCASRLPSTTLSLWEESLHNKVNIPSWQELDSFLTRRFHTLESIGEMQISKAVASPSSSDPTPRRSRNPPIPSTNTFQASVHATSKACNLCDTNSHALRRCTKFRAKNVNERWELVRRWGLCYNCLAWNHVLKDCTSQNTCFQCKDRHNSLLHRESSSYSKPEPVTANTSEAPNRLKAAHARQLSPTQTLPSKIQSTHQPSTDSKILSCLTINSQNILLGTAIISVLRDGVHYPARALIDSGSEGTFMSERFFHRLKLPFRSTKAHISGISNAVNATVTKYCNITISSKFQKETQIPVRSLILKNLIGCLPSTFIDKDLLSEMPPFQLADPKFLESNHIDVLLGADFIPQIMLTGVKRNICRTLIAQESIFGWIISGPIPQETFRVHTTKIKEENHPSLDMQLKQFWELEELPRNNILSEADRYCEELFTQTTSRMHSGRYMVKLPFRPEYPTSITFGESRPSALALYLSNDARLRKDPDLQRNYDEVLQEYKTLQHAKKVQGNLNAAYYLPHHAVIKPDSSTTKVRIVFNASHPTSNHTSLNDLLYPGPTLQADLKLLIVKWRLFQFVFNGDLEKMYRQILVDPEHTPFQRILIRNQTTKTIEDYELLTVTFGVNCAPYLAIRTLLQLAQDNQNQFPLASDILQNYMYVDDALGGAHDIATAILARDELIQLLRSAGFNIRKWTSNISAILQGLPSEHLLRENFLEFDDVSHAKTLGIRWNALSDAFYFQSKPLSDSSSITKRNVLSQIAKLFDPVGWLAPVIIRAKIIMQEIWKSQVDWDEDINEDCRAQWAHFLVTYSDIETITIPRWVGYSPKCHIQFHHFCDASERAYAAAIYIRINLEDHVSTQLLISKTRVAPIKTQSLPRLELCGAVLVAELSDNCLPHLPISHSEKYFWTDSTIVLAWLNKPPCHWSTFVANRVSKIVQSVGPSNWFHVESASNPADLGTRGQTPIELSHSTLWWHGPKWLTLDPTEWPKTLSEGFHTGAEEKLVKSLSATVTSPTDLLTRFSSFPRAIRVLSYIFRFFYRTHPRLKAQHKFEMQTIMCTEIQDVTERMIILTQRQHFRLEYEAIKGKNVLHSNSTILSLNPFLDSRGMLRIAGRLGSCPSMSYNERHPIILPYDCAFSRLYVSFVHHVSLHGEAQLMLRLIRLKYWIPRVKNMAKAVIHNCKVCLIYRKRIQTQLMGTLPSSRTTMSRPFTNTGLDFAGPFDIRSSNLRKAPLYKGYVCVFICFSTKAIHLECTTDLSTSAFLAAFQRFISRRGCPAHLYSDNGTTFVGADKSIIKEFFNACRFGPLPPESFQQPTWHFIPPSAPHMGGLWEAAVKSFKIHLRKISGPYKYTFEEFSTLLAKIEGCLNSRPLVPINDNPSELGALTPGHFLTGGPILAPAEDEIREEPISTVNRWQRLRAIHQEFCAAWKHDYLVELQKRSKWKCEGPNIQLDDLVVIREDNLQPMEWRLGRIVKLYPGQDNLVRVADIRTQRGIIRRPITKLVLLPQK